MVQEQQCKCRYDTVVLWERDGVAKVVSKYCRSPVPDQWESLCGTSCHVLRAAPLPKPLQAIVDRIKAANTAFGTLVESNEGRVSQWSKLPRIPFHRLRLDNSELVEQQEGVEVRRHWVWADPSAKAVHLPKQVEVIWVDVTGADSLDFGTLAGRHGTLDTALALIDPMDILQAEGNIDDRVNRARQLYGAGAAPRIGCILPAMADTPKPLVRLDVDAAIMHVVLGTRAGGIYGHLADSQKDVLNHVQFLMPPLSQLYISMHRLSAEGGRVLGRGASGEVSLYRTVSDGGHALSIPDHVAVKWVTVRSAGDLTGLRREITAWRIGCAVSKQVCPLLGVVDPLKVLQNPENMALAPYMANEVGGAPGVRVGMVMPVCDEGDLSNWLKKQQWPGAALANGRLKVAMTIVEAVSAMHAACRGLSITLNDIKPENILMMGNKPVLIDFGGARWQFTPVPDSSADGGAAAVGDSHGRPSTAAELLSRWTGGGNDAGDDSDDGLEAILGGGDGGGDCVEGTYRYMAPERVVPLVSGEEVWGKSDVYSVGLIVWQLLSEPCKPNLPFPESLRSPMRALYDDQLQTGHMSLYGPGQVLPALTSVPQQAVQGIVEASLSFDPQARPTMDQMQSIFSTALTVHTVLTSVIASTRGARVRQTQLHLSISDDTVRGLKEAGALTCVRRRTQWLGAVERGEDGWGACLGLITANMRAQASDDAGGGGARSVDGFGLEAYVRSCLEDTMPVGDDQASVVASLMDRVGVIVAAFQPNSVQTYLDTAQSLCIQYIDARERPDLAAGTVATTANSHVYQRWRELAYWVHTASRRQAEAERDLRVSLYDAWMDQYRLRDAAPLVDQVQLMGGRVVNGGGDVRSMVVYHGTSSLSTALSIVQHGMLMLNTTDQGWYGQGYYFTPDLKLAATYSGADESAKGLSYVVVCAVLCGNVYPVVEHPVDGSSAVMSARECAAKQTELADTKLSARGLVSGFDTHIAWVDMSDHGGRHQPGTPVMADRAPAGGAAIPSGVSLEVVVRDKTQILPVAVLGMDVAV